jgi:hydroxyacylglutathione hydrolase
MHASKHDTEMRDREVEEAFHLFTNGTDGPISLRDLRRVAKALGEEVSEELLRNMILEANGGAGVSRGVGREDFEEVMRRAGVWP